MIEFTVGLAMGMLLSLILHGLVMESYKRVLVMKAKDGSAEHINGNFYYIKEEGK